MLIVSDTVLSENNAVKSCLSKRQSGIFRTVHLRPIIINADGRGCVFVCVCVCVCVRVYARAPECLPSLRLTNEELVF